MAPLGETPWTVLKNVYHVRTERSTITATCMTKEAFVDRTTPLTCSVRLTTGLNPPNPLEMLMSVSKVTVEVSKLVLPDSVAGFVTT